jgi:hypothetical protein
MADLPLRVDADPQWQEIHEAADAKEASLARVLYAAFSALTARAILLRVREAIRLRDVESALQAVPVADLLLLQDTLTDVFERAASAGATVGLDTDILVRLGTNAGLNVADIRRWARGQAAALVTDITEETRRALREIVVRAVSDGTSPARASRLIESVIGLNRQGARAVRTRWLALLAEGVPADRAARIVERLGQRLVRQRARVIARHELLAAANAGRRAVWERNVREGLILPDRWEREWVAIVPSDGRTCRICVGLDGQRAPINGNYPNGSSGPPAHVICRCTEVLVRTAQ